MGSTCLALIFVPLFSLLHLVCLPTTKASNGGFRIELMHRNTSKANTSKLFGPNAAQSQVKPNNGEYVMKLSFGTPPVNIYGLVDTGSDLIWAQCLPCDNCYNQVDPVFDPKNSSTFTNLHCQSDQCHELDTTTCSSNNLCNYTYGYGDNSITQGVLAKETITFTSAEGEPISLPNIVIGCGHNNSGTFNDQEMGLIGLGGGPMSLVSQLGSSLGRKGFSHCLVSFHTDPGITSKMNFGTGSEVEGDEVVSTPLVAKQDPTPYFVTLEGISVGETYVPFNSSSRPIEKGNMFIDSGTPPTILPQDFYDRLAEEVKKQVQKEPIEDDPSLGTQLCYSAQTNLEGPILTAHFEGADVQLTPTQIFIPPGDGVFCFAMTNTSSNVGVYGNFVQTNFLIGYDLEKKAVSFKATDCTK